MQESQKLHAIFEKLHRKPRDAANEKKSSRLLATLDKGNLVQTGLTDVQTLKHEYLRKKVCTSINHVSSRVPLQTSDSGFLLRKIWYFSPVSCTAGYGKIRLKWFWCAPSCRYQCRWTCLSILFASRRFSKFQWFTWEIPWRSRSFVACSVDMNATWESLPHTWKNELERIAKHYAAQAAPYWTRRG